MKVIPAVDIREGRCVQLVEGDPEEERYSGDPVEAAERWVDEGADLIHVVNLDGAFSGELRNREVVREVLDAAPESQVGGGVRSPEDVEAYLELGADRVIVGTKALEPGFVEDLAERFGPGSLLAALDCRGEEVVVEGWRESSGTSFREVAPELEPHVWGFLYTDVEREGHMEGVSRERVESFVETVDRPVLASGGVSSVEDLRSLSRAGAWGAVVGSALYEGAFGLGEAMEVAA